ncbi:MAG: glycine decarboxylase subunit P [Chrysothrix sp. TS-e1954]|nr:MAG: glycine decarboxylase subunit P [Chrysothrix sp. TS-e1954]
MRQASKLFKTSLVQLQVRHLADDTSITTPEGHSIISPLDTFFRRHVGVLPSESHNLLRALDPPVQSLEELTQQVIPPQILSSRSLEVTSPQESAVSGTGASGASESQLLSRVRDIAYQNEIFRSYIGCGYAGTIVPEVIKRNVLKSPAWYTSYTPYQAEISQGRLESLLNFQTVISELTGLTISNSSLLDEPTAAAEAMIVSLNALSISKQKKGPKSFLVSDLCHPQTIAVLHSRAHAFGIKLVIGDVLKDDCALARQLGDDIFGVLVQYPDTLGGVEDFQGLSDIVHSVGGTMTVATDLLALTVLTPPGEFGADIAIGSAQRFGVPFGYGGPHAGFMACSEKHKRKIPGRLVGMSKDRLGDNAIRLALQTREQHIRREKATSNICTSQVLLANMSAFYAVYHGPQGLTLIAQRVMACARILASALRQMGLSIGKARSGNDIIFDTVAVHVGKDQAATVVGEAATKKHINLRLMDRDTVGITLDETVERKDLEDLLQVFAEFTKKTNLPDIDLLTQDIGSLSRMSSMNIPPSLQRRSSFLTHPTFNSYHSETELLRYIYHLQSKDLSLAHSMIPLGSCTMKLNGTTEMVPITWPEFASIHPFVPLSQAKGYQILITELEKDLAEITGFDRISLQPNSGAQGEFTALLVIRRFLESKPDGKKRDICLIPVSAHGTNPASAAMAGMRVVKIRCEPDTGNLDLKDLHEKCERHREELGAIMVTYPSTFGIFEPQIKDVCDMVHSYGGQVYMDGANMNAQIGLCSPGEIGADACHLNLHKTFCIPHGGGGPGVGPIGVKSHLAEFLPGHPLVATGGSEAVSPVSGAPWGSAGILPISWAYIKMMGARGLTDATKITLLNANYILSRLKGHYKILHTNNHGRCAHEFILDTREFKNSAGVEAIDVAKRLQDYGFHAPTMSWPVENTLMIEPTESESQAELDRFCDALISIRHEIKEVENGAQPKEGNVLKMAPHTQKDLLATDEWDRPYSRSRAAYPLEYLKEKKFWPTVTRLNDGKHPSRQSKILK